jgi:macrolide-specific efflux system membrane fusion protein
MKTRVVIVTVVAVVLLGLGVLGAFVLARNEPSTQYATALVTRTDVVGQVTGTGALSPVQRFDLAFGLPPALLAPGSDRPTLSGIAKVRWPVLQVKVEPGQSVVKGAVLATASPTDAQAQLAQATSDVALAGVRIGQAEADLKVATDPVKIHRFQTALANARADESTALHLQADLRAQLTHANLVAPAAGVVEVVNIIGSADAPPGEGIILDSGSFQAVINIGESALPKLTPGASANLTVTAIGQGVVGTVASVGFKPSGSSAGVPTYPVTFNLATMPPNARIGMTVQLTVTLGEGKGVLAVPAMALKGKPGSYTVFVLAPAGDIQVRALKVGLMNVASVQVIAGVAEGEKVILDVAGAASPSVAASSAVSSASLSASPSSSKKNKKSPSPTAAPSGSSPTSSGTNQ